MTLRIVIPTWSRCNDLLPECLESINDNFDQLVIIKNPHPDRDEKIAIPEKLQVNTCVIYPKKNLGCAGSWNVGLSMANWGTRIDRVVGRGMFVRKSWQNAVLINDDIVLVPGAIKCLVSHLVNNSCSGIAFSEEKFSFWALSYEIWSQVGLFDESFWPAYYEDLDWLHRFRLLGFHEPGIFGIPGLRHARSSSIPAGDRDVIREKNERLYNKKWGGGWTSEKFSNPYGI